MFAHIPRFIGTGLGVALLVLAALIVTGAVSPATAAENELSISQERVDCDTARITVGYRDLVDTRSDKILRVFIDADGDGVYPAAADAVIRIEETGANDSDVSIWSEQVPAGSNVLARLREDNNEGPNPLLDEDEIAVPDADCDDASISIRKVVEGVSNDPTNFNVDFSAGVPDVVGIDENDSPVRRGDLTPGLYILTEYGIPSGYEFVSWVCESDQLGLDYDTNNALFDVSILLRPGEDVHCVLSNRPKPPAPTATAVPPTATSVPAPVATAAPQTIIVPPAQVIVNVPPAPAAPTAAPSTGTGGVQIRPPSTGDGGLVNTSDEGSMPWTALMIGAYGGAGLALLVAGVRRWRR